MCKDSIQMDPITTYYVEGKVSRRERRPRLRVMCAIDLILNNAELLCGLVPTATPVRFAGGRKADRFKAQHTMTEILPPC